MATHSSVLARRIPDSGAWWAAVYGVAQSRTRLKQLSSSSSSRYENNYVSSGGLQAIFPLLVRKYNHEDCVAPSFKGLLLLLLLSCFSRVRLCATP